MDVLDGPLPKRLLADQDRAPIVAQGARHDLRRARAALVHQDRQPRIGRHAAALGAVGLALAVAVRLVQHHPVGR